MHSVAADSSPVALFIMSNHGWLTSCFSGADGRGPRPEPLALFIMSDHGWLTLCFSGADGRGPRHEPHYCGHLPARCWHGV